MPGTGKTGARGEGREILRGALGNCAQFFRLSLTTSRCAVGPAGASRLSGCSRCLFTAGNRTLGDPQG
jgi:hypothetical protein